MQVKTYSLTSWFDTSQTVTPGLFGGNVVGSVNTNNGYPTSSYGVAVEALGINSLRYPAGQPEEVYTEGMVIDGALPEHFQNFMNWAKIGGQTVVVVTPTGVSYPGSAELKQFTALAVEKYGDIIEAFEIGNEYWGSIGEREYGKVANESAQAINEGLEVVEQDIDIWVQMANPSGAASDYGPNAGSWISRTLSANQEIIDQLSSDTLEIIDGVVEHYYLNKSGIFGLFDDVTNFLSLDIAVWKAALGQDTTVNITEWNIKSSNESELGMKSASAMIAQFSYMMDLGVDTAFVWPLQHNTTNDLAGSWDKEVILETDGIVTNSIGGATYSMLAESLPGKNLLKPDFSNSGNNIKFDMFGNSEEIVLYVSSRSEDVQDLILSLDNFGLGLQLAQTRKITYDKATSNGEFYSGKTKSWKTAESVNIDGQKYYLNEHDVQAKIVYFSKDDVLTEAGIDLVLYPFEVVELTLNTVGFIEYRNSSARTSIEGTIFADRIAASNEGDFIKSFGGDDYIAARNGDDHIVAGSGNDFILAGAGDDYVSGWGGDDIIRGGSGSDKLLGLDGDDSIFGGRGRDTLLGGEGKDTLFGNRGGDTLVGGLGRDKMFGNLGSDVIRGGKGKDVLVGGGGSDKLYGGKGNDIISGGKKDGVSDRFIFSGNFGNDLVVDFESGVDVLVFRGVADRLSDLIMSETANGLLIVDGDSTVLISNSNLELISNSDIFFDL